MHGKYKLYITALIFTFVLAFKNKRERQGVKRIDRLLL